ncbi:MAG: hypothetical protein ACTSR5_03590 [Promethearchaeota archaeon]
MIWSLVAIYQNYFFKRNKLKIDDIENSTIYRILELMIKKDKEIKFNIMPNIIRIIHDKFERLEKQKKENLEEIQSFRIEQEKNLSNSFQKRQNLVKDVLQTLSDDIEKEISLFKDKISTITDTIVKNYEVAKPHIIEKVIQQLGLDLNG